MSARTMAEKIVHYGSQGRNAMTNRVETALEIQERKIAIMREALEFYSAREHWFCVSDRNTFREMIMATKPEILEGLDWIAGDTARRALAAIDKEGEQ